MIPNSLHMFDLTGQRVLVTGSSRGIGYALACGLAGANAQIVLHGRDADRLTSTAERLREVRPNVRVINFDVCDHRAAGQAIDRFERDIGPIDILVNNAGIQHRAALEVFDPSAFENVMRTNVNSIFNVGQAVAQHMIARQRGKIINICSVMSRQARAGISAYTASKGAAANLTKAMAAEWAKYGLQINGLAPGYFKTELTEALVTDPEFTKWLEMRTPAGRWGELGELTRACIFLASEASSYVNGHVLYVDGGLTASL